MFISYFLQIIDLKSFNDKTSVPGVNRNHLHALQVGTPEPDEQKEIARRLSKIDLKIKCEERRLNAVNTLLQALLHVLMTGKLRLNPQDFPSVGGGP